MTPNTKKYLFSAATAVVMLASTVGIAGAHMGGADGSNLAFAQSLASRFNLNVSDVQTFMTQQQTARMAAKQAEMQTKMTTRLSKAVSDGKITEAQKQLIITKQAEVQAKVAALKNITDASARKTAMKAIMDDVSAWAKQNNIPKGLFMGAGPGMKGEFEGRGGMGKKAGHDKD